MERLLVPRPCLDALHWDTDVQKRNVAGYKTNTQRAPRLVIRTPIMHVNNVYTAVLRLRYVTNVHNMRHPFHSDCIFSQSFRFPRMDNTQCVCPFTHSPSFPLCSFCPSSHSCCWIKLNNSCGAQGTWLVCCWEFQQTIFYSSSSLSCSLRVSELFHFVSGLLVFCVCVFVCMYVEHHPHVVVTIRQLHYLLQHTKQVSSFSTDFYPLTSHVEK